MTTPVSDNFNDNTISGTWYKVTYNNSHIDEKNQQLEMTISGSGHCYIEQEDIDSNFCITTKIVNISNFDEYCGFTFKVGFYGISITNGICFSSAPTEDVFDTPTTPFWFKITYGGIYLKYYYSINNVEWIYINAEVPEYNSFDVGYNLNAYSTCGVYVDDFVYTTQANDEVEYYGLQTFDSAGEIKFNSMTDRIARVVDIRTITYSGTSGSFQIPLPDISHFSSSDVGITVYTNEENKFPYEAYISTVISGSAYTLVSVNYFRNTFMDSDYGQETFPTGDTTFITFMR